MRYAILLATVGLAAVTGCSRTESEAQMRERIRRQEQQRVKRQAEQARRLRAVEEQRREEVRRRQLAKERADKREAAHPTDAGMGAVGDMASHPAPVEPARKRPVMARPAAMSAPPRPRARYYRPPPRRRLKRPRRRLSPSLEGLFN